ncbi:MAG TPA: AGE family epimerase/isomerase [Anaerolineae bacterium]|nr:AGE family epimerase/isomerase [Anaerolineae bacterium]HPL27336.1 AGE family epimerase/isomerase [Anaerolineae bacterium]
MQIGVISPQDWGWPSYPGTSDVPIDGVGASPAELERRVRAGTYEWLLAQFDEQAGAFHGFYSAPERRLEPPQTVNLIAPWQLLAAYDRYHDGALLATARRAADWFYRHFVVSHPMSVVMGGVREGAASDELWTKFAAEYVILCVGLHRRTGEEAYLRRAHESAGFLLQAARHGCAPKYNTRTSAWQELGWQSFGRAVEACLELERATVEPLWRERALRWGELGLGLQAGDGGFYLIDGEYFNTDLAADELRALTFLYERTGGQDFLGAAQRFAAWLLARQRPDGAWPLTIDRDDNVVVATVGPGDVPNIAIALLRLFAVTGEPRYRQAALAASRYSLSVQATPGSTHPYLDDPHVRWGFWSWDPYYDYTLSADQSTHHVRGMIFLLDSQSPMLTPWPT